MVKSHTLFGNPAARFVRYRFYLSYNTLHQYSPLEAGYTLYVARLGEEIHRLHFF